MPTVSQKGRFSTTDKVAPTISPLNSTGIKAASHQYFRRSLVVMAASRVARLPKRMSCHGAPPSRLPSRQPRNSPGTLAMDTMGSSVSASATRNCMAPKLIGASARVSAAYSAAMMPLNTRFCTEKEYLPRVFLVSMVISLTSFG